MNIRIYDNLTGKVHDISAEQMLGALLGPSDLWGSRQGSVEGTAARNIYSYIEKLDEAINARRRAPGQRLDSVVKEYGQLLQSLMSTKANSNKPGPQEVPRKEQGDCERCDTPGKCETDDSWAFPNVPFATASAGGFDGGGDGAKQAQGNFTADVVGSDDAVRQFLSQLGDFARSLADELGLDGAKFSSSVGTRFTRQ